MHLGGEAQVNGKERSLKQGPMAEGTGGTVQTPLRCGRPSPHLYRAGSHSTRVRQAGETPQSTLNPSRRPRCCPSRLQPGRVRAPIAERTESGQGLVTSRLNTACLLSRSRAWPGTRILQSSGFHAQLRLRLRLSVKQSACWTCCYRYHFRQALFHFQPRVHLPLFSPCRYFGGDLPFPFSDNGCKLALLFFLIQFLD